MPKFMVRIVLHDAKTWGPYDQLHDPMIAKGFERELPGKKAAYHLPLGEYWYQGDSTAADVRVLAAAAVESAGQDFGVIVVRVDGWSVMRLKKVEAAGRK